MKIKGIALHPGQEKIKNSIVHSKAKFHIINASRQSGKSTLLSQLSLYYAINNKNVKVLWVAPVYNITKTVFMDIVDGLYSAGVIKDYSKGDQTITFVNNSTIVYRSATNYDNIRGGSYDYIFVDEFAYIADDAWNKVIRPTLAVRGKKAFLASTPKGKNLFYELANLGMEEDNKTYRYHYMNYRDNPFYDLEEVADAKKTLPDAIFKQEYEAEFVGDEGLVFENLGWSAQIEDFLKERITSDRYFAGLDLARQTDYTVLTIMNQHGEVVFVYRVHKISWELIVRNIIKYLLLFKPILYIEVNSIGDVIFDKIRRHYRNVKPFVTQLKSKNEIIEDLIYEFSDGNIKIPSKDLMPEFFKELSVFTFSYNKKSRTIHYSAPPGFHDDIVISLALANKARRFVTKKQITWATI